MKFVIMFIALAHCATFAQDDVIPSPDPQIVEANVPPAERFAPILKKSLSDYFRIRFPNMVGISYELLRTAPARDGGDFPKFYAWVEIRGKSKELISAGAVRLSAVEKKAFTVTDYVDSERIKQFPNVVESTFPKPLIERITNKAKLVKSTSP